MLVGAGGSVNVYGCHSLSYRNQTDVILMRNTSERVVLSGLIRADESVTSYFDALRCERSWQSWNMQCWRRYARLLLLNFNTIGEKKHPLLGFSEWFHAGHKCLLWSSVNLAGPWWAGPGINTKLIYLILKEELPEWAWPQNLEGWGACMYFYGPFCVCNTILCGKVFQEVTFKTREYSFSKVEPLCQIYCNPSFLFESVIKEMFQ